MSASTTQTLLLVDDGKPRCCIVLDDDAGDCERYAARELSDHLRAISGATLPVTTRPLPGAAIVLGRSRHSLPLLEDIDWHALGDEGVVLRRRGDRLVLAGASPRGTLYAVYEWLEQHLGVRWLTPDCTHIPRLERIAIDQLDAQHLPGYRMRDQNFMHAHDATWAARNRLNGQFPPLGPEHGGQWRFARHFVHTFYALVPPQRHYDAHPEYFSLVNGERLRSGGQLCLTNADVLDLVCREVADWLEQAPDARLVSISQNDWHGACECSACRAIDEAEGSHAGTMVRFVNAVAECLEPRFPDALFSTLAYTYTVQPPRHVRPRHNVVIYLCHMGGCDSHAIDRCEINRAFMDQIAGWGAIAPEVFVWDYYNNFHRYFQPYPNLHAIAADVRLMAEAGVTGFFAQGDASPRKGPGDMAELRAWLLARLCWNPSLDAWAQVDEFCRLYYGPAGPIIREHLDALHEPVRQPDGHVTLYDPADVAYAAPAVIDRCEAILDRAAAAVSDDPVLGERVASARLPIELMQWSGQLRYELTDATFAPSPGEPHDRAVRFFALAEARGARGLAEGGERIEQLAGMLTSFEAVTVRTARLELTVVPDLGGRIGRFVDRQRGIDWMHQPPCSQVGFPNCGGYDEYTEAPWRSPGWCEHYTCQTEERSIVLTATLGNGLRIERTCTLADDSDGGTLTITTRVHNSADKPRLTTLRPHPELNPGALDAAELAMRLGDDSNWRTIDTGASLDLTGEPLPTAWRLRRGDTMLTMTWPDQAISRALVSWDRSLGLVRPELFAQPTVLERDQSMSFVQVWRTGGTDA